MQLRTLGESKFQLMENNLEQLEYDGKCAFALSLGKTPPSTNHRYTLSKNGKTYAFMNPIARFLFKLFPGSIEKADKNWRGLTSSNEPT